ncbi:MAG: autotransporter-associated beta strand repeat-containing protein [Luteolibacter sp.]
MSTNASTTSYIDTNNFNVTLPGNISGSGEISLPAGSGSLILNSTGTQTISAGFADTLPIRKTGTGTTILSGTSSHSGTVTVEAGRLDNTGSLASTVTVNSSATLGGEGTFNGDVYFNSGSGLVVEPATAGAATVHYAAITGPVGVSFSSTPLTAQMPITLFNYTGGIVGSVGDLTFPALRNPVVTDTGSSVTLSFTSQALVWNGASGSEWDAGTSPRWNPGETDRFYTGDAVTFDDTGVTAAVTLTGSLTPASIAVGSSTNNYALTGTGSIGGSATLSKSGTSTLTLGTANSYTGATSVTAGTLQLGSSTALGSTAAGTTIASGATLDVNGQNLTSSPEPVTVGGTGVGGNGAVVNTSVTGGTLPNVTLSADSTFNIAGSNTLTLGPSSATATGNLDLASNTLTKNGTGTLILNSVSIPNGNIVINQGAVQLLNTYLSGNSNFQQAVSITSPGMITINSGAKLSTNRYAAGLTLTTPITLNGGTIQGFGPGPNGATIASPITLAANSTFDFNAGGYSAGLSSVTFSGVISGPGNLTRIGGSGDIVTLSGANTYTGTTLVSNGTVKLGNASALGAATAGTTIASGATLDMNGQDLGAIAEAITITGTGVGGNGALINSSTTRAAVNNLTLGGNATITNANPLLIGANGTGTSGTLNLGSSTLTKNGTGDLILNGITVSSGSITVNAGRLMLTKDYNNNQQAVSLTGTGTLTINAGAKLATQRWASGLTVTMPIVLNSGELTSDWPGPNNATIASPITLNGANIISFAGGYGNGTLSGVISGTGSLTRTGAQTAYLTNSANTYSGGTTITSGSLAFNSGALGSTGNVTMNGGTLIWNGTNGQDISSRLVMVTGVAATLDVGTNSVAFGSGIGGATTASLTKLGAGTLALNGANNYTGATTLSAGTLILGGSTTSAITAATGTTVGGEGLSTAAITLNEGTTLLANAATTTNQLTTTGAVAVNKTTTGVTVQLQNAPTTVGAQSVPLIKYGTQTGGTTNFNVAAYRSASVSDDTTNKILKLNYTSDAKIWNGVAGNTTWDLAVSSDWSGADLLFYNGDSVAFTDAATSKAVTLTGVLQPAQVTFSNTGANAYTFSGTGSISGTASLAQTGTGTTYLTNGANTYSGGTVISAGILGVGNNANENANALGTGPVTINAGGKLGFYPGSSTTTFNIPNAIVLNGGTLHEEDGYQHFLGTVSVTADSTVTGKWNPKSIWFDGVVSGSAKLNITNGGNGAWVAFTNGANTYSGTVAVNDSVNVVLKDNNTLQFATIDAGASTASVVQVAATNTTPNVVVAGLKGTAIGPKVINADATARTLTVNNATANSFTGTIGDGTATTTANGNLLSLVKSGVGTLTLGGASTYSGATAVVGGTLVVNAANASSATTVSTGATLQGTGTFSGSLTVTGTVAPGSGAVGTLTAGSATIAGTYACEINGANADKLAVTGALTLSPGSTLAITTVAAPTLTTYTIATYTGTAPAFTTVTGLPSGFTVDYSTAGQIRLVQSGFSGWVAGFGLTGGDAAAGADPDHDGIVNAVEYVLGGNPATGTDSSKLPTISLVNTDPDGAGPATAGDYVLFTFRRTAASVAGGTTAACEFDADLTGTWTTAVGATGVVQNVTTDGFGTGVDKVEVYIPKATWQVAGKLFARLRVTVP